MAAGLLGRGGFHDSGIFRYAAADVEYTARQELLRILVCAFLFLAILNNLHRQESTHLISFTLIFLAMGISCFAVYQFITDRHQVWQFVSNYPHRAGGTYICPNHLGGFLEMLLPLALAFTLAGRLKPVAKVFLGYAALVMAAGIAVTASRGSWFSTALALVLFFGILLFHRDYRLAAVVFFGLAVGGALVFAPRSYALQRRFKELTDESGQVNDDLRFSLWQPALRMWKDHFWWGVGPAHFDELFPEYRPEDVQKDPEWAHNDYVNTLAEWGTVGTGIVFSAFVLVGLGALKSWRYVCRGQADLGGKSGSNKFALLLGCSLGLLAILCHSMVDFNMHIPANAILAVTLMALLSSCLRFASDRYWFTGRLWTRLLASMALLGGLAFFGCQTWRRGAEYLWLHRAEATAEYSPERVECLKKAFAREPLNGQTAFKIGEILQTRSREGSDDYPEFGNVDYHQLAAQALEWLGRSQKLNPHHAYSALDYGGCLDWLGRSSESGPFFARALELDPNGYYTLNYAGLHYIELRDYAAARRFFERSSLLEWVNSRVAKNWLGIINDKLLETAAEEDFTRQNQITP